MEMSSAAFVDMRRMGPAVLPSPEVGKGVFTGLPSSKVSNHKHHNEDHDGNVDAATAGVRDWELMKTPKTKDPEPVEAVANNTSVEKEPSFSV